MKKFGLFWGLLVIILLWQGSVFAFGIESVDPWLAVGGFELIEKGVSEGHKFFLGAGLDAKIDLGKKFGVNISLSRLRIAEGFDEDTEMPEKIYTVKAELDYRNEWRFHERLALYPYTAFAYQHWERNERSWHSLDFADLIIGAKANYKMIFARFGVVLTNRGGFETEIGAKIWRDLTLSYFYQQSSKHCDSRINTSGGKLAYQIKF